MLFALSLFLFVLDKGNVTSSDHVTDVFLCVLLVIVILLAHCVL